jgi:hypothetical protein
MKSSLFEWKIPVQEIVPAREKFELLLGPKDGAGSFESGLDSLYAMAPSLVHPRAGFCIFPLVAEPSEIVIQGIRFSTGEMIARGFENATHAAIFVGTIGPQIERYAGRFMKSGEVFQGYLFDLFGSEAAEHAAEFVHTRVIEYANDLGLGSGNRYSPGYCGWDVSAQKDLFSLLPQSFCGVNVTDSSMMTPVKSVSGIIPVGKEIVSRPYSCAVCTRMSCSLPKIS